MEKILDFNIKKLKDMSGYLEDKDLKNYDYVIIARDKWLSGWGKASGQNAYTYLLVKGDTVLVHETIEKLMKDGFKNVNWFSMTNEKIPFRKGVVSLRYLELSPLWL